MMLEKAEYRNIIKSNILFSHCNSSFIESALEKGIVKKIESTAELKIDLSGSAHIGILLEGKAVIYSGDINNYTPLRFIMSGDCYGIAGIFLNRPIVSKIVASSHCTVFMLSKNAVFELFELDSDGVFRNALLCLLSEKVRFLNFRFRSVSAGSNEQKLALFLLSTVSETGVVNIRVSMKALAASLGMGRASLYRVIDSFEKSGLIIKSDNGLVIPDINALSNQL